MLRLAGFVCLVAFLLNAFRVPNPSEVPSGPEERQCTPTDPDAALQRFSRLLQFQTLADASQHEDHIAPGYADQFAELHRFLESAHSSVYESLQVEKVGIAGLSRLYTWSGTDTDPTLKPILFISHVDIVPVTPGTEADWTHPPFSGALKDGYVWGRGALDVKFSVAAILEAVAALLQSGFSPKRTIIISFGSDEEVGGTGGAAMIAQYLADKKVELECIVDEGGVILSDGVKGIVDHPVALVGTAEKLYTSVRMELTSAGGHSSMPPTDGSDIASQAARVVQAVNAKPTPAKIRAPISDFLSALAPYPPFFGGLASPILENAGSWPLNTILAQLFVRATREVAALVRTTVAVTKIHAGVADNVLPNIGHLSFNMRAHPETPRQELLDYLRQAMAAAKVGPGATLHVTEASHPGPFPGVSPSSGPEYELIKQAIQEHWRKDGKAVAVAPYLLMGGTDSKHFAHLTQKIYRFVPYSMNKTAGDLGRIHSTNERVLAEDFTRAICTYTRMIELLSSR